MSDYKPAPGAGPDPEQAAGRRQRTRATARASAQHAASLLLRDHPAGEFGEPTMIGGWMEAGEVTVLAGGTGVAKTTGTLHELGHLMNGRMQRDPEAAARSLHPDDPDPERAPQFASGTLHVTYFAPDLKPQALLRTVGRIRQMPHLNLDESHRFMRDPDQLQLVAKPDPYFDGEDYDPDRWARLCLSEEGVTDMIDLVKAGQERLAEARGMTELPPSVVVLDTWARLWPTDGDESGNIEVARLAGRAERLAAETGAAVIIAAHISQEAHKLRKVEDVVRRRPI